MPKTEMQLLGFSVKSLINRDNGKIKYVACVVLSSEASGPTEVLVNLDASKTVFTDFEAQLLSLAGSNSLIRLPVHAKWTTPGYILQNLTNPETGVSISFTGGQEYVLQKTGVSISFTKEQE